MSSVLEIRSLEPCACYNMTLFVAFFIPVIFTSITGRGDIENCENNQRNCISIFSDNLIQMISKNFRKQFIRSAVDDAQKLRALQIIGHTFCHKEIFCWNEDKEKYVASLTGYYRAKTWATWLMKAWGRPCGVFAVYSTLFRIECDSVRWWWFFY